MRSQVTAVLLFCAPLVGCPPPDATPPEEPVSQCRGDAPVADLPISDDASALAERFDTNQDLVRIQFLGEPF